MKDNHIVIDGLTGLLQAKAKPAFYWGDKHYRPVEGEKVHGKVPSIAYVYEESGTWCYHLGGSNAGWFDSKAIAKEKCELAVANWLAENAQKDSQDADRALARG